MKVTFHAFVPCACRHHDIDVPLTATLVWHDCPNEGPQLMLKDEGVCITWPAKDYQDEQNYVIAEFLDEHQDQLEKDAVLYAVEYYAIVN